MQKINGSHHQNNLNVSGQKTSNLGWLQWTGTSATVDTRIHLHGYIFFI